MRRPATRETVTILKMIADSPRGMTWLLLRAIQERLGAEDTDNAERKLLEGLIWRSCAELRRRSRHSAMLGWMQR